MRRPVFTGYDLLAGELAVDNFAGGVACPVCGARFVSYHNVKRYCSDACRVAAKAKRDNKSPERACRVCAAVFVRVGRGQSNKQFCSEACSAVVCAWGAGPLKHPALERRASEVRALLLDAKPLLHCFGRTKHGWPRHPLYLPATTVIQTFCGRSS